LRILDWSEFYGLCENLANKIKGKYRVIYPIHKNGLYVANFLSESLGLKIIYDKESINDFNKSELIIVDDLVDSGRTLSSFKGIDKAVLFVKNNNQKKVKYFVEKTNDWIRFPFEKENDIEENIVRMLEYIGEDPTREGLIDTPKRIVKSWDKLYGGYKMNPKDLVTSFQDGACDEVVILKNIEFYSVCEHHNLPFFGKISIGYLPRKKVIGVSKLARIVEVYARRMQIQEKMTTQIADCIVDLINPRGVMVVCEAQHFCVVARGVEKKNSLMVTSAIRGAFRKKDLRDEFLNLIK